MTEPTAAEIEKLLPCPFCSSALVEPDQFASNGNDWSICCNGCKMIAGSYGLREHAIAAWNTRPPPPATDNGLLERLEALLAAATPGEWEIEEPMNHELWIVEAGKQAYEWRVIAGLPWPDEKKDIPRKQVEANAALITEAVNALPGLIATIRSQAAALSAKEKTK